MMAPRQLELADLLVSLQSPSQLLHAMKARRAFSMSEKKSTIQQICAPHNEPLMLKNGVFDDKDLRSAFRKMMLRQRGRSWYLYTALSE